jgi:hypothetical protein
MKFRTVMVLCLLVGASSLLVAHDLFIKLDSYFLAPNARAESSVLNGTFHGSENYVTRDRVLDVSVVAPAGRIALDTTAWSARGDTSVVAFRTGQPGTYVIGASTRGSEIDLEAEQFNEYLAHDGIPDVLDARRRDEELDKDVRERYSKHVKAVFQVGLARTEHHSTPLGYPAEILALDNPYTLEIGSEFRVLCLVDGRPVANQLVIDGGENQQGRMEERSTRTNDDGVARFVLDSAGKWYVKFTHMVQSPEAEIDYESKWATLTFAIR